MDVYIAAVRAVDQQDDLAKITRPNACVCVCVKHPIPRDAMASVSVSDAPTNMIMHWRAATAILRHAAVFGLEELCSTYRTILNIQALSFYIVAVKGVNKREDSPGITHLVYAE